VLATQNPIEQEGTYPLRKPNSTRFMFNIIVTYPNRAEELEIMKQTTSIRKLELDPVLTGNRSCNCKRWCARWSWRTTCSPTRPTGPGDPAARAGRAQGLISELIAWGAGPRASQYLILGGKARAILHGRLHVTPTTSNKLPTRSCATAWSRTFNADAEGVTTDDIIDRLIKAVPAAAEEAAAKMKRA